MPYQPILDEVEHLNGVSVRLEGLADQHPRATQELLTIAGNVRSVATLLAVLVATKLHGQDGLDFVHLIDGRRDKRVPIIIVVRLLRLQDSSLEAEERTFTDNVSKHGACVISRYPWQPGDEVQVTSVKDGTAIRGRVVHCQKVNDHGGFRVGLDFQRESVPWSSYSRFDDF